MNEQEAVAELEEAILTLGLKGLKLHPGIQGFSPADPMIFPLIKKAAELKIPIFIHMYPWPFDIFHFKKPEHIYALKKHVPDAVILVGHFSYQHFMDLISLASAPGIYIETSFGLELMASLHGIRFAERLIRRIGIDRIVFGSDWMDTQDGNSRIADNNLNIIDKMELTQEEKSKILGRNIETVLALRT